MENIRDLTLAELVNRDSGVAVVFDHYHLDFCCQGKRTLAEAVEAGGLNLETIIREVENRLSHPVDEVSDRYESMSPERLVELIEQRHHEPTRETIPVITARMQKVAGKHGTRHPELQEMALVWEALADELTAHMEKEELVLFPYLRRLAESNRTGLFHLLPVVPVLNRPVGRLEIEHRHAGSYLDELRALSLDYSPPEDACMNYQQLFRELEAFEVDLHKHVHLENNVLFPKGLELERKLLVEATR